MNGTFTLTRYRSEHNHPLIYLPTVKDEELYNNNDNNENNENDNEDNIDKDRDSSDLAPNYNKNSLSMLRSPPSRTCGNSLRVTERMHRAHHTKGIFKFFNICRSEKNTNNGEYK